MGDLAWLAPMRHKDIGESKSRLEFDDSLLIGSRPGSALSIHSTDGGDNHHTWAHSQSSMHITDTKWQPHKPPMSAVKGAWQQNGSRASSANRHHNSSRSASPSNEQESVLAVFNLAKNHKGHLDEDSLSRHQLKRPVSARSMHGRQIHVDGADSVNKNLEDNIDQLDGSLTREKMANSGAGQDYSQGEFVPLAQTKSIYGRAHSPTEKRHGQDRVPTASNRESVYKINGFDDQLGLFDKSANNMLGLSKSGNLRRNGDEDFVVEDLERENGREFVTNNLSEFRTDPSDDPNLNKGKHLNGKGDSHKMRNNRAGGSSRHRGPRDKRKAGDSGRNQGKLNRAQNTRLSERNSTPTSENETELPSIIVDDIEKPSNRALMSSFKTKEDVVEARKRKLRMKMRYANAFKHLFDEVRAESMKATLDLGNCYNAEDLKVAKTDEKKEQDKNLELLKPHLPHGLPLKDVKYSKPSKSKSPSYVNFAEAGQVMVSPESIKLMRETLDEKRQQLFGEQPWLLGRLALSKETCRFELPMDVLVLKSITPLDYVTKYTVISRRRKSLYKSTFIKNDKDRDGWISYKDLVKALKDIHVNYIDENEMDKLTKLLDLNISSESKYNMSMFYGIAAFSERLVMNMRKHFRGKDPFGKERLEDADFDNMKWKIKDVNVNPEVLEVLKVL